mgnify:FL=1
MEPETKEVMNVILVCFNETASGWCLTKWRAGENPDNGDYAATLKHKEYIVTERNK